MTVEGRKGMKAEDIGQWIEDAAQRPGGRETLLTMELAAYLLPKFQAAVSEAREDERRPMACQHPKACLNGGVISVDPANSDYSPAWCSACQRERAAVIAAMERAAKEADKQYENAVSATQYDGEWGRCAKAIASSIRRLKDKE